MKKHILLTIMPVLMLNLLACQSNDIVKENFDLAENQTRKMLDLLGDSEKLPRTINPDGTLETVGIKDWTSGFFPGILWYLYDYTQNDFWQSVAGQQSEKLLPVQYYSGHHDIGFMMYCSYGNAYRLTKDKAYEEILVNTANSLSKRFIQTAGVIRSWDFQKSRAGDEWHCPVIIDNMMNLELLFFASKITGNNHYRDIAISHADSTLKYHVRPDYSTYHVVNFDTLTGQMLGRYTYQGYADSSAWARGQAWGIYGFTLMYRETKDPKYLDVAEKMAGFYLNHPNLPEDKIPYWDFDAPDIPDAPRDASAGAIVASALLELSGYSGQGKYYFNEAEKMLQSLSKSYTSNKETKHSFIINHSVGHYMKGSEIDVPLNYADYYYLEALLRYDRNELK